jgi:hypothetical protein
MTGPARDATADPNYRNTVPARYRGYAATADPNYYAPPGRAHFETPQDEERYMTALRIVELIDQGAPQAEIEALATTLEC